jgi:4-amino-4-deoxy-L-arabinose transferase-like glycosyltransferase
VSRLRSSRLAPLVVAAAAAAFFCVCTLTAIDRPGLQYDETAFVNAALGADHTDQHFVHARFGGVITKIFPYIGALKSWIYAPVFEAFGVSMETIRIPAVLLALLAIALAFRLAWRLFGPWPAVLLIVVLATDPVYATMAKADWGPIVIGSLLRVGALLAYFALLRTRSHRYAWLLAAALLLGIFNKIDFVWFLAALGAAALAVHWRELWAIVRERPLAAAAPTAAFAAILAFMAVQSILPARQIASPTEADTLGERWDHRWELFHATFDGTAIHGYMVGTPLEADTPAPGLIAGAVLMALVVLLLALVLRDRLPREETRVVAFFLIQFAVIAAFIVGTRQVGGSHHVIQLWPVPHLLIVSLVVLLWRLRPRALRLAATGAALALLAWLAVAQVIATREYVDAFRDGDRFTHVWTPEIYDVAGRAGAVARDVDGVVAADWGIGPQVFALNGDTLRERFLDVPNQFQAAGPAPPAGTELLRGKRVVVVFHREEWEIFPGSSRGVRAAIHALGPRVRVTDLYGGEVLRAYLVDDRAPG